MHVMIRLLCYNHLITLIPQHTPIINTLPSPTMHLLQRLDRNPSSFSLNYDGTSQYKSKTGGLLSLIYLLTGLIILGYKLSDVLHRNHVQFTTQIIKENDMGDLDISSGNFSVLLMKESESDNVVHCGIRDETVSLETQVDSTNRQKQQVDSTVAIKFSEYAQNGLKVSLIMYNISVQDHRQFTNTTEYDMIPCPNSQLYACMPQQNPITVHGRTDFSIPINSSDIEVYRRWSILIRKCNQELDAGCKEFNQRIKFFIRMNNNAVYANATQHEDTIRVQQAIRVFQSHQVIRPNQTLGFTFYFKKAAIQTYTSVLPQIAHNIGQDQVQRKQGWFYDEQFFQQKFDSEDKDNLLWIYFKRSAFTHVYSRQYLKLDQMLGQFFGMMSLLAILIYGVYSGYNGWSFQQMLRQKLGLSYTRPTILAYYRQAGLLIFIRVFRCWRWCRQRRRAMKKKEQELVTKLDYINFQHRTEVMAENLAMNASGYETHELMIERETLGVPERTLSQSLVYGGHDSGERERKKSRFEL